LSLDGQSKVITSIFPKIDLSIIRILINQMRIPLVLFVLFILFLAACSSKNNLIRGGFPSQFQLDVSKDILETLNGNTFVAHVRDVNPVFGRALTIKVRGLKVESIEDQDSSKASIAFRQWHKFQRKLKESNTVEIRNLERGIEGFWVWADVYLDGKILLNSY
jgi:hypothetical protein